MARRLGWNDDLLAQLAEYQKRDDLSGKEKVALRFAERMTLDPNNVDEALWAEFRKHFDEGEAVELAAVIGLFNYFNRFNDALQMEPTK
ncbi:MAG: carboxymuconolactone decarboxylase family protein [Candidatus Koribacter versatilis]|uniref:Carboxymuconolactone decarboxylase family protein n=1 Tax=Candidatus Korobacter versatilis TaxID=658062 RepID=A0A932A907_9BACT|nr:carboxymuconolactone decarboxylase family protein [Candidatus Koribacter versatilis]